MSMLPFLQIFQWVLVKMNPVYSWQWTAGGYKFRPMSGWNGTIWFRSVFQFITHFVSTPMIHTLIKQQYYDIPISKIGKRQHTSRDSINLRHFLPPSAEPSVNISGRKCWPQRYDVVLGVKSLRWTFDPSFSFSSLFPLNSPFYRT